MFSLLLPRLSRHSLSTAKKYKYLAVAYGSHKQWRKALYTGVEYVQGCLKLHRRGTFVMQSGIFLRNTTGKLIQLQRGILILVHISRFWNCFSVFFFFLLNLFLFFISPSHICCIHVWYILFCMVVCKCNTWLSKELFFFYHPQKGATSVKTQRKTPPPIYSIGQPNVRRTSGNCNTHRLVYIWYFCFFSKIKCFPIIDLPKMLRRGQKTLRWGNVFNIQLMMHKFKFLLEKQLLHCEIQNDH